MLSFLDLKQTHSQPLQGLTSIHSEHFQNAICYEIVQMTQFPLTHTLHFTRLTSIQSTIQVKHVSAWQLVM